MHRPVLLLAVLPCALGFQILSPSTVQLRSPHARHALSSSVARPHAARPLLGLRMQVNPDSRRELSKVQQSKEAVETDPQALEDVSIPTGSDPVLETMEMKQQLEMLNGQAAGSTGGGWDQDVSVQSARGMIILAALLCGTNFGGIKLLQQTLDPAMLLTVRFSLAAAAMAPLLVKGKPGALVLGFETGLWLAAGYISQAIALQGTGAGTTAFLCSLTTIVCPVIEFLAGSKVGKQAWGAAGMAAAGAAFLELAGGATPGWGDAWGCLQPVAFGYFFWKTEQAMAEYPDQALPITAMQVVACALGGFAWAAWQSHGMPDFQPFVGMLGDVNFDLALLWIGLMSTALILVLETIALGVLPSSETAVVFSSEPLWGTIFASILLGETVGVNQYVGGSLIIFACIFRVLDFEKLKGQLGLEEKEA